MRAKDVVNISKFVRSAKVCHGTNLQCVHGGIFDRYQTLPQEPPSSKGIDQRQIVGMLWMRLILRHVILPQLTWWLEMLPKGTPAFSIHTWSLYVFLVGDFNPSGIYYIVKLDHFPIEGWTHKNNQKQWNHHLVLISSDNTLDARHDANPLGNRGQLRTVRWQRIRIRKKKKNIGSMCSPCMIYWVKGKKEYSIHGSYWTWNKEKTPLSKLNLERLTSNLLTI